MSYEPARERGVVKRFSRPGGYGFIARDNGERDAFVHIRETYDDLHIGDIVTFEVIQGNDRKPKAMEVRRFKGGQEGGPCDRR
jgi:cold shock CspA family protein